MRRRNSDTFSSACTCYFAALFAASFVTSFVVILIWGVDHRLEVLPGVLHAKQRYVAHA